MPRRRILSGYAREDTPEQAPRAAAPGHKFGCRKAGAAPADEVRLLSEDFIADVDPIEQRADIRWCVRVVERGVKEKRVVCFRQCGSQGCAESEWLVVL